MIKNNLRSSEHKTTRKYSLWIGCAVLVLGIWLMTNSAFSIPNCCGVGNIKPANSWIPHEHSKATITYPVNGGAAIANPDGTLHQHRSAHSLYGSTGNPPSGNAYDAFAVWDNKSRRTDDDGQFGLGHGFIDEYGYGFGGVIIVRYKFSTKRTKLPPGNQNQQNQFKVLVNDAFEAWSALKANPPLVTGLEFEEVGEDEAAEIVVQWEDCDSLGECTISTNPLRLTFDSQTSAAPAGVGGWSLAKNPATVPPNQFHFYSTALHEVGHLVGLDEQNDRDDVMYFEGAAGCPQHPGAPADAGPCFDAIDTDSVDGALDLYSIPTPDFGDAPATYPTLLANNGARAPTLAYEWLGPRPADGKSTTTRERDAKIVDQDEMDDGCDIKGTVPGGQAHVSYTVSVNDPAAARYTVPSSRLYVAIWVDWNGDGDWTNPTLDPGELLDLAGIGGLQVREYNPGTPPTTTMPFKDQVFVPATAIPGPSWMRCRLIYGLMPGEENPGAHVYLEGNSGDEGLLPLIDSPDNGGEIEDHKVCIGQPKADKKQNSPAVPPGGSITFTITLENTTLCDYESVELFDALSGHVAFGRIIQSPPGIFYNPDRLALDGEFPLASGESATIVYTVTVGDFVPAETIIPNCVTLDGLSFRLERCTESIVTP